MKANENLTLSGCGLSKVRPHLSSPVEMSKKRSGFSAGQSAPSFAVRYARVENGRLSCGGRDSLHTRSTCGALFRSGSLP